VLFAQQLILSVDAGSGHATYYGGSDASGTNNGACGYTNVFSLGYGSNTCALSDALFNGGKACGACYRLQCTGSSACTGKSLVVTATNNCPQGSYGGWCDGSLQHFDLSQPAFQQIAQVSAGHVPVSYTKTSCSRSGGIKFSLQGHTYYLLVLVYNVGGAGDLSSVSVKGSKTGWISMQRTWGVNFSTGTVLDGQALSFQTKTSDGRTVTSNYATGSNWYYGQTYSGSQY
jgi:expansin (peptidoglycan-binding protein)